MAVDQVSARSVQAFVSTAAQDASALKEGSQLEGRVVAVNPDSSLKLSTRYGLIDVDPSQVSFPGRGGRPSLQSLPDLIGKRVKIEVTGHNATGRLVVKLASGGETVSVPADDHASETDAATRIAAAVSRAAARQDGLAQVFAGTAQLAARSRDLPDAVSGAIEDLAAQVLDLAKPLTAAALSSAVSASGLFLEAKLARLTAAGDGSADMFHLDPRLPVTAQDLKAALFGLKAALEDWVSATPAEVETGAGVSGETPGTAAMSAQTSTDATSGRVHEAPAFDTDALFAVMRPPPVLTQSAPQVTTSALTDFGLLAQFANRQFNGSGAQPDTNVMSSIGEWLEATGQLRGSGLSKLPSGLKSGYGGATLTAADGSTGSRKTGAETARPPPPRRGSLPHAQGALTAVEAQTRRLPDLARALATKVGDALARVSLGQYASLPDHSSPTSQKSVPSGLPAVWLFEIPLRLGQATSIAQFEIDQVNDGSGGGDLQQTRAWRVQFSLDLAPLGPVHARVLLTGRRLSIGLWAEQRPAALGLQHGLLQLRQTLVMAGFTIDELHFALGRPPSGPPVRAGGFIDRNA